MIRHWSGASWEWTSTRPFLLVVILAGPSLSFQATLGRSRIENGGAQALIGEVNISYPRFPF